MCRHVVKKICAKCCDRSCVHMLYYKRGKCLKYDKVEAVAPSVLLAVHSTVLLVLMWLKPHYHMEPTRDTARFPDDSSDSSD